MTTTIAVRFELGRYHATRWDGGANTSDVEWPPSPWRILRALLATRHTRWPELPSDDIARLLAALGTPAAYRTPGAHAGTTRHYMPLPTHRTDSTGATAQVIDAFLAVPTDDPLLVQWAVDLPPDDRVHLRKLLELVPYLGRSESLARLELLDDNVPVDDTWWRLGVVGPSTDQVQLLAPTTVTLPVLEQTTTSVRKARRTLPPGTATLVYGRLRATRPQLTPSPVNDARVQAMRFELAGLVHLRARSAVLAADAMHGLISKILTNSGLDPIETAATMGLLSDGSLLPEAHQHLHILPVPTRGPSHDHGPLAPNAPADSLVLWAPRGVRADVAAAIVNGARTLRVAAHLEDELPSRAVLFAGTGTLDEVYPWLLGSPSRVWTSWLPYLPVRHRKKHQDDWQFIVDDVNREATRHLLPPPRIGLLHTTGLAGQIAQFRRRRNAERADRRRRGVYLQLTFDEPQKGPVLLGQLSHYGYGVFRPISAPDHPAASG